MQDTVQQIQKLCEDAIGLFSTLSKRAGELSSQLQTQVDIERLQRLQRVDEEAERYKQRLCEKAEQDMAKLEEQRRRLHAEVEELQRLKQPWKSGRVRLDVGGKTFTTSQSTLTRFPDSLLGKMFSGRHPLDQDEEGRVFLDRDGKLFAYVLDFLRDEAPQQQWQPPADPQLQQKVLREFQYFGIPFPSSSSTAPSPSTSTTTTSSSAPSTASTGSEGLARALQPPDKRRSLSLLNPLSFLSLGSSFSSAAPTTLSPTTNPPPIATAGSAAVTPSFAFSSSFLSGSTTTSSASSCPTSPSSSPLMRHVKTNTPYTLNVNGSMPARSSSVGGAISGSHSKATHTRKSLPPGGSLPNLSSVEADAAEEIFTGKLEGHTDAVMALAVIDGGRNIITASSDGVCRLYDLATGRCLKTMQGHTDWLSAVAVSKDGTRAISGSWDLTAKVWDLTTTTKDEKVGAATSSERARCLGTLTGHTSWVMAVALSADGKSALTGSRDWTAKLWLLDEGATPSTSAAKGDEVEKTITCHQTLRGHSDTVSGVCFLEEDNSNAEAASAKKSVRKVVTASFDQTCRLWDVYSGLCLCILSGHEDVIYGLSLIPTAQENTHENGSRKGHRHHNKNNKTRRMITASGDRTCKLWDLDKGKCVATLQGHQGEVLAVAVSGDGRLALSGSMDNTAMLWDIERALENANKNNSGDQQSNGNHDSNGNGEVADFCLHTYQDHTERVYATALITTNTTSIHEEEAENEERVVMVRAITGSADSTVRVWPPLLLPNTSTTTSSHHHHHRHHHHRHKQNQRHGSSTSSLAS